MNDETFVETARKLAERMISEGGSEKQERIRFAYEMVLARPPKPVEMKIVLEALAGFETRYRSDVKSAKEFLNHGDSVSSAKFDSRELAAYSSIASLILNLDEAATKQ
jgi:hypothetical protein